MADNKKPVRFYEAAFKHTYQSVGIFPYDGDGTDDDALAEFKSMLNETIGEGTYEIGIFRPSLELADLSDSNEIEAESIAKISNQLLLDLGIIPPGNDNKQLN